jgi:hypothetical protein
MAVEMATHPTPPLPLNPSRNRHPCIYRTIDLCSAKMQRRKQRQRFPPHCNGSTIVSIYSAL